MRHVYGPVPSRRLGRSLGIDPVPPKTCNWNCVYCQLGRTTPLSSERRDLAPVDEVLEEVQVALDACGDDLDWVTFVGSGEPTLHSGLGRMIREVQAMVALPTAVITNGALLHREDVRRELAAADAVMPSLDAGSEALYRAINRPYPGLSLERHLGGLAAFRRGFAGRLWLEVMLVAGLNDTEAALRDLAGALLRIDPDAVHVNVPSRPPAETWVRAPELSVLERARSILGTGAHLVLPVPGDFELDADATIADAVVELVTRHPTSDHELMTALSRHWASDELARALRAMVADGRVQLLERQGQWFWTAGPYRYARSPSDPPLPGTRPAKTPVRSRTEGHSKPPGDVRCKTSSDGFFGNTRGRSPKSSLRS
jgi:wyosine [tRNA(Phe)-imidazoG37] synthetase (radical SAM superfamily)